METTVIRENLMTQEGYTPYCGNMKKCAMPRTFFNFLMENNSSVLIADGLLHFQKIL